MKILGTLLWPYVACRYCWIAFPSSARWSVFCLDSCVILLAYSIQFYNKGLCSHALECRFCLFAVGTPRFTEDDYGFESGQRPGLIFSL
jgi:hypothetical protein